MCLTEGPTPRYAIVEDPDGNVFDFWEADPNAFPPLEPED